MESEPELSKSNLRNRLPSLLISSASKVEHISIGRESAFPCKENKTQCNGHPRSSMSKASTMCTMQAACTFTHHDCAVWRLLPNYFFENWCTRVLIKEQMCPSLPASDLTTGWPKTRVRSPPCMRQMPPPPRWKPSNGRRSQRRFEWLDCESQFATQLSWPESSSGAENFANFAPHPIYTVHDSKSIAWFYLQLLFSSLRPSIYPRNNFFVSK